MTINDVLKSRIEEDSRNTLYVLRTIRQEGSLFVCKRKKYIGLRTRLEKIVVPCIYDDISAVRDNLFVLKIGDYYQLLNTANNNITPMGILFDRYIYNPDYLTIELHERNYIGLYSIKKNRLVIPIEYEDTTISAENNFLWVKQRGLYHFIARDTGKKYNLVGTSMAYDNPDGMFAKRDDGTICCYDNEANADYFAMRRFIIAHHGRGEFYNIKYHIIDITDVYGQVLNPR